jgi:hypothetical protein
MPLMKVIFRRIHIKSVRANQSLNSFRIRATVGGEDTGDAQQSFEVPEGNLLELAENDWSHVIDPTDLRQVTIQTEFFETPGDARLGSITHILRPPWRQADEHRENSRFSLDYSVELEVAGEFGRHAPNDVFACRERPGGMTFTTVSGGRSSARLEFHPVRPVPGDTFLPTRPPGLTGAASRNGGGTVVRPTDSINIIPNPAVIPVLTSAQATEDTASRIEYTFYQPRTLNFTDNDDRLEWSVVSVAGGASVAFLGPQRGLKVFVYGTAEGEVRLEVRYRGILLGTYRALVAPLKEVPCRFNILNGPNFEPRSRPADIQDHLAIANRFLRQMAIELVLDTDPTVTDGAVATDVQGIFRIPVTNGRTRNIPDTGYATATRLNYRPNVMNFAYIVSDVSGNLGAATDYPASTAGRRITDNGTPSTSWIRPSGIPPEGAARQIRMNLLARRQRTGHPQLFAMYVTNANGNPTRLAAQQTFAGTIAHEFGHILNLGHRVEGPAATPSGLVADGIFSDGLWRPPGQNVMHWVNPTTLAQDFDIIQARGARSSPLMPP